MNRRPSPPDRTPAPGPVPGQGLCIVQVSTLEERGGAARVAANLHRAYCRLGLDSWMAVGRKQTGDPSVVVIPNHAARPFVQRALLAVAGRVGRLAGSVPGAGACSQAVARAAEPWRTFQICRGVEDFYHPGSRRLLELWPRAPDIVHCHNLHGGYFDLRFLPELSRRVRVVLTLHDAWMLSGHCAHSFECERWQTGCGACPDLTIYPPLRRDATAYNWRRKRDLYARSRLYVSTPCRWLMHKVERSILARAIVQSRVIPYGVDLAIFRPGDRSRARQSLGLPADAAVLLFTADGIRQSRWKDYASMRHAIGLLCAQFRERKIVFVAVGEEGSETPEVPIRFVPFTPDPAALAAYYQAADIYVHAARADTFPNSVLEALASGAPVVATAVGGIPEQVRHLHDAGEQAATGILTPPGDPGSLAAAIRLLLTQPALRARLGENAAHDARRRFDLQQQVRTYLCWYQDLCRASCAARA